MTIGNSIDDKQMTECTQGDGTWLRVLVHHDDDNRETPTGRSPNGTFTDALMAQAKKNAWTVISMKNDWKLSCRSEVTNSQTNVELEAARVSGFSAVSDASVALISRRKAGMKRGIQSDGRSSLNGLKTFTPGRRKCLSLPVTMVRCTSGR